MVTHYQPGRIRRNSDRPTAITGALLATQGSYRTGEIPLGTPTCSSRSRRGGWALYPNGAEVVVVHPDGALTGAPAEVARELGRLGGNRQDEGGRSAARTIAEFLADPDTHDRPQWPATWARTWSSPAVGYRLSGPANQPGDGDHQPPAWPGAPARLPRPLVASPSGNPLRHGQAAPRRAA
ncbi:MAG TPA: hypothetical protein VF486_16265 [Actinomycetes bacterium]